MWYTRCVMEIPYTRWYPAIKERRSKRIFDQQRALKPDVLAALEEVCNSFRPFPHARAVLVKESIDTVFTGILGSYGKVRGAPALIAFIGQVGGDHVPEEVGYTGEGIILEATALWLNTCWVAGFFRETHVAGIAGVGRNEKVLAVTPVGYALEPAPFEEKLMSVFGLHRQRKPLARLVTGVDRNMWPDWIKTALEAARLAPSAVNRQPWGFHVERDGVTVFVRTGRSRVVVSKRLDCGIAMLHAHVGALQCGQPGKWEFLQSPQIAKYRVVAD